MRLLIIGARTVQAQEQAVEAITKGGHEPVPTPLILDSGVEIGAVIAQLTTCRGVYLCRGWGADLVTASLYYGAKAMGLKVFGAVPR